MIEIVSGTNRPGSRTHEICKIVLKHYQSLGAEAQILDLKEVGLETVNGTQYTSEQPPQIKQAVDRINKAQGLVMIIPEYNGSYPGALKYFIDHWIYPDSFEHRPVAFIGLGGRFGGLRPVEHLQGVFGYRNAYVFPQRVFLMNIFGTLKEGTLQDSMAQQLLEQQSRDFLRFIKALKSEKLDACSVLAAKK